MRWRSLWKAWRQKRIGIPSTRPPQVSLFSCAWSCTLCGIVFGRRMLLCCCCCCCCCFDFLFHGPFCYGILETRTHILFFSFLYVLCSLFFLFVLFSSSLFSLFSLWYPETDYDVVLHLNPQWLHPTLATNSKKKKKSSSHRNHLQIKDAQRYANNKSIFSATHTLVLLCSRVRFVDSCIETKLNCFTFFGISFFLSKVRQFGVVQWVQKQQRRTKGSVVGGVWPTAALRAGIEPSVGAFVLLLCGSVAPEIHWCRLPTCHCGHCENEKEEQKEIDEEQGENRSLALLFFFVITYWSMFNNRTESCWDLDWYKLLIYF